MDFLFAMLALFDATFPKVGELPDRSAKVRPCKLAISVIIRRNLASLIPYDPTWARWDRVKVRAKPYLLFNASEISKS
jgi:hypothetical protein